MKSMYRIPVRPLNFWEKAATALTEPLAVLASGAWDEDPNSTRFWNNEQLSNEQLKHLDLYYTVHCQADPEACEPQWGLIPRSHIPIFGGWRKYVVLESAELPRLQWYVGWRSADSGGGISRIPVKEGKVRMLIPNWAVNFFGTDLAGFQIAIRPVDYGEIGKGGPNRHLPLH